MKMKKSRVHFLGWILALSMLLGVVELPVITAVSDDLASTEAAITAQADKPSGDTDDGDEVTTASGEATGDVGSDDLSLQGEADVPGVEALEGNDNARDEETSGGSSDDADAPAGVVLGAAEGELDSLDTSDAGIGLFVDFSDGRNFVTGFELSFTDTDGETINMTAEEYEIADLSTMNAVLMNYEITIPKDVYLNSGDTYTLTLPSIYAGSNETPTEIRSKTGVLLGNYTVSDGKVTIVFVNAGSQDGVNFNVAISGSFHKGAFDNEREVIVEVPYADESSYKLTLTVKQIDYTGVDKKTAGNPYTIDENGQKIYSTKNPTHVDWTVIVNDGMEPINKAEFIDKLDTNSEIDLDSIKIVRIIRNWEINETDRIDITNLTPESTSDGFKIDLGSISDAYEISYTTRLIRPDGGGSVNIKNTANIVFNDGTPNEVTDNVDVTWSGDIPTIDKEGAISDNRKDIINWTVKYNFGKENLGTVNLTDVLDKGEVLLDTIKVVEVETDIDGNYTTIGDVNVTTGKDSNDNVFISDLDANGKAYLITFDSTVPLGLNNVDIKNTISDDLPVPNSDSDTVNVNTIPTGGKVGNQEIDADGNPYIEWTITMNSQKVNVGSITVGDIFNPDYLTFDVTDESFFKMYQDEVLASNFEIKKYVHTIDENGTPDPEGREGFKLTVNNAGPHTYKFVYRTYYTVKGMEQPQLANRAELIFFDGNGGSGGTGTGNPIGDPTVVDFSLEGPKANITKTGQYVTNPDNKSQEIKWTITFNDSQISLDNPELIDTFTSNNYSYIAGSLEVKSKANDSDPFTTFDSSKYTFTYPRTDGQSGFTLKINEKINHIFEVTFRTTTDDTDNLDHRNDVTLKWQGGEESDYSIIGKRSPGITKGGEVTINSDGSKTVNWEVKFNTNKNILGPVTITDTYTPNTVTVSNIKLYRDNVEMQGADYDLDTTIQGKIVVDIAQLDAVEYRMNYSTTLSETEELQDLVNYVVITYPNGPSQEDDWTIGKPTLGIQKQATKLNTEPAFPVISWKVTANTYTQGTTNNLVNLVLPVLSDEIPGDQRLVENTIKVVRVSDNKDITQELENNGKIKTLSNSYTIYLPNGAYQYIVTFDTEILEYPSFDGTKLDRYNNTASLGSYGHIKVNAPAYQDYFLGGEAELLEKTGSQNNDTENIDWKVLINPTALTIKKPKITDTLSSLHSYLTESVVLKVEGSDTPLAEGADYFITFSNDYRQFDITFEGSILNQALELTYETRLNQNLIGTFTVGNTIKLTGGTEGKELDSETGSSGAQQWFYGGGGSGTTVDFKLNKQNSTETSLKGIEFNLYLVKFGTNEESLEKANIITDDNGVILSGDIRAGRYILREKERTGFKSLADIYLYIRYADKTKPEEAELDYIVTITDSQWNAINRNNATADGNEIVVTNEYTPVSANISTMFSVNKVLVGQTMETGQFSFALTEVGATQPLQVKTNNSLGNVAFDNLTFDEVGEYSYTITETNTGQGGMAYDDTTHSVVVTVEYIDGQPENGLTIPSIKLDGVETIGQDGLVAEFNNTYTATNTSIQFNAFKDLTGQPLEAGQFSFELKQGDVVLQTKTNDALGNVVFDEIEYTQANDMGKTYVYTISEISHINDYMDYDSNVYTITVNVVDNRDGTMGTEVSIVDSEGPVDNEGTLQFENTYIAKPVDVTFEVQKRLAKQSLEAKQFTFTLTGPDNYNETLIHDADGKILFDAITFTDVGEYIYTISEVNGGHDYMIYDDSVYTITVFVTDDREGQLVAEVVYSEQTPTGNSRIDGIVFENTYDAEEVTVGIQAHKILSGQTLTSGRFKFNLVDEAGVVIETVTNTANGDIIFSELSYDEAGVHRYTIEEVNDGQGGIIYDKTVYTVEVKVTDYRVGQLIAEVIYPGETPELPPTFSNKYIPAPDSVVFEVTKVLDGQELRNEQFEFELLDSSGTVLQTKTNNADGQIIFDEITYTAAGTYTYEVREVAGTLGGITYDTSVKTITVTVTDAGVGQLNAEVDYGTVEPVFTNTYATEAVETELQLNKQLSGRALKAGEFSFRLRAEDGTALLTSTNAADGQISFSLTHTEPGVYVYTVEEVRGSEKGMTYDSSVKQITVTITDDGEGQLVSKVDYEQNTEFKNSFEPEEDDGGHRPDPTDPTDPTKPGTTDPTESTDSGSKVPQTGTSNRLPLIGLALLLIGAGLALVNVYYKRRRNEGR